MHVKQIHSIEKSNCDRKIILTVYLHGKFSCTFRTLAKGPDASDHLAHGKRLFFYGYY